MLPVLLAHHVELYHVPVLSLLFAAGLYIGWRFSGLLLADHDKGKSGATAESSP